MRSQSSKSSDIPGLALCFLTFPLNTVSLSLSVSSHQSLQSSELDLQTPRKAEDTQAVEETVIINEIVEFINTNYQSQSQSQSHSNRQQAGAESVFYCSEGCFVLDKNTSCYHKHLST